LRKPAINSALRHEAGISNNEGVLFDPEVFEPDIRKL
jgi:hypothetical protein